MFGIILFRTVKKFNVVTTIFPPHTGPTNQKITDALKVSLPLKLMFLYPFLLLVDGGRDAANTLISPSCFCSVLLASLDSD